MASNSAAGMHGFVKWRSHPARIALTRSCGRSEPVNAMSGMDIVAASPLSWRAICHPSMSGKPRSSTMTAGAHVAASANASLPVAAVLTSNPDCTKYAAYPTRVAESSSTKSTRMVGFEEMAKAPA
jgi:hypothetical protein